MNDTIMRMALSIAALGLAMLVTLTVLPRQGAGQLAVVIPPWKPLEETMAALIDMDLRLVRPGLGDRIVIVDTRGDSDLRAGISDLGLILIDPKVIGACAALVNSSQVGLDRPKTK
ncbi:hypothetical protein HH303_13485 [Rhodospirillaceae bacterium KN72]|uniref:Uncharacterized protein n=1 Tax=Pacificispira spongiicola TaxID=2729598 RepID=A0A7Y0HF34_9PROT|nr:hypothetical protein [Pacificispira spongiicola]NMM45501.1 hypothetical protein [Pacificispira spongiicola]